jgi:hypothetical protein
MRDVATPMLEAERHAKVKMRRTVRGLRTIEREGLQQRRPIAAEASAVAPVATPPAGGEPPAIGPAATPPVTPSPAHQWARAIPAVTELPADAGEVVLDDWSAVRGRLNDDQGGPFQPPG